MSDDISTGTNRKPLLNCVVHRAPVCAQVLSFLRQIGACRELSHTNAVSVRRPPSRREHGKRACRRAAQAKRVPTIKLSPTWISGTRQESSNQTGGCALRESAASFTLRDHRCRPEMLPTVYIPIRNSGTNVMYWSMLILRTVIVIYHLLPSLVSFNCERKITTSRRLSVFWLRQLI